MNIIRTIDDSRVIWTTKAWSSGDKQFPAEEVFDEERALALLLINEVVFLNCHWWEKEWPEDARNRASINVNCNDIFVWGCADAETINHEDIEPLYRMWIADPEWGAAKWCAMRRQQQPQTPVIDLMKKAGAWDAAMQAVGVKAE